MTLSCVCGSTLVGGACLQCGRNQDEARRGQGNAALPYAHGLVTGFDLFALPTPATSMTGSSFHAPHEPNREIDAEFDPSDQRGEP